MSSTLAVSQMIDGGPRMDESIWAVVVARMGSERLPGKSLAPLAGRPALFRLLERLRRSRHLHGIVLATTTNAEDDVLEQLAREVSVSCFRGSSNDVLDRTVRAARSVNADIVVDITGDCPLVDHRIVDRVVGEFLRLRPDYAANTILPSYPNGMDVQVYPRLVLEDVDLMTHDAVDREHVTLYIYEHPEKYRLLNIEAPLDQRWPDLRLTLDTREDYALISAVYDALYSRTADFSLTEMLAFLRSRPELLEINRNVMQKPVR